MASLPYMPGSLRAPERRSQPRLPGTGLQIMLRPRGSLRRSPVTAVDFNRHGLAVLADQPLRLDVPMVVKISHHGLPGLVKVIGIVHNCARVVGDTTRYRCGIAFRPQSPFQSDSEFVEAQLRTLEALLLERLRESA